MKGTINHKKDMRVLEKIQNIASLTLIHLHTEEQSLPPWPSEHKFGSSRFRRLWDITLFESHNTVFLAITYIDIVIIINIVRFTPWYFWNCGQHCPQNNSKHCPMIHVFIWTQPQWVLGTLSPGPTEKSSQDGPTQGLFSVGHFESPWEVQVVVCMYS